MDHAITLGDVLIAGGVVIGALVAIGGFIAILTIMNPFRSGH